MPNEPSPERTPVQGDHEVVRRLFERVYSKGELRFVDELVTPDYLGTSTEASGPIRGPAGLKSHVIRLRTCFHGFTTDIETLDVQRDTVEVSWTARGTHERRFLEIDPTCNVGRAGEEPHGNRIAVPGITTGTVRDGRIHDSWMGWDVAILRHQLGSPIEAAGADTGTRNSAVDPLHASNETSGSAARTSSTEGQFP